MMNPSQIAPIKDIFLSGSMEALLKEFFMMENLEYNDDDEILEFHRRIFGDLAYFKKFLCLVRDNNFSCIEGGSENIEDTALYLYICDCLRSMTSDKVQSLLEISKPDIKKQMQQCIPGTKFTFSQSLQAAVFFNIPINEKGEVVYILGKIPGGYEVFSYESSFHQIDNTGKILRENMQNMSERRRVLERIWKYERFQVLLGKESIDDAYDQKLAIVVLEDFATREHIIWTEIQKDQKKFNLYLLRLRSYVVFQILDLKKEFQRLQREDTSSQKNIALVGGTDMGD